MKSFIYKTLLFLLPLELIIIFHLVLDPFRIIYDYEDYYKNSFVAKNRGEICYRTYIKNRAEYKFDSFIFGSSRSQAFKAVDWEKHLPATSKAFHFDASGEGVFGVQTKISYIDEIGDNLNNVLIIFDEEMLQIDHNTKGYFVISPPNLSKEPVLEYYSEFVMAGLDIPFIVGYLDYSLFGTYRPYMKKRISRVKYQHRGDPINGDIFYGNDLHIKEDSVGYYQNLIQKGVFYDRTKAKKNTFRPLSELAISQLRTIKSVFDKHSTDYSIVISPLYDQAPFDEEKELILHQIFGEENIYNFSGKNELTEPIHHYYENSHYRPKVARRIMDIIYSSNN